MPGVHGFGREAVGELAGPGGTLRAEAETTAVSTFVPGPGASIKTVPGKRRASASAEGDAGQGQALPQILPAANGGDVLADRLCPRIGQPRIGRIQHQ